VSSNEAEICPSNLITAVTLVLKLYKAGLGSTQPGFCAIINSEKRKTPINSTRTLPLNLTKRIFFYLEKLKINYLSDTILSVLLIAICINLNNNYLMKIH
jgi:hypothetical protein